MRSDPIKWTRADFRHMPRKSLERLARYLGVAHPEYLAHGLLVHEVFRRARRHG